MGDHQSDRIRRGTRRGASARHPLTGNQTEVSSRKNPKMRPVWFLILVDFFLLGVALNVYAISNRAFQPKITGAPLPVVTKAPIKAHSSVPQTTGTASNGEQTESPPPAQDMGMFGANFPDKFTSGDVQQSAFDKNSGKGFYKSKNVNITVTRTKDNGVVYFLADIYIKDLQEFRSAFSHDAFPPTYKQFISDQAKERGAILGINGDDSGNSNTLHGYIARDGNLYLDTPYSDILVMFNDGTMQTYGKDGFDLNVVETQNSGIWQMYSFGPMLLDANSQPMTEFAPESITGPKNSRTAIGYFEPGHYCFLVVDGRQEGYSFPGMTTAEMSQLFSSLGCKAAYNLDGGHSTAMVFCGQVVNHPEEGGRRVSDLVYIKDLE